MCRNRDILTFAQMLVYCMLYTTEIFARSELVVEEEGEPCKYYVIGVRTEC